MRPDNKEKTAKTEFIDFLRQNFTAGKNFTAVNKTSGGEKKVLPAKNLKSSDEDIRAVLRATLPLKNDKLALVLNKHLPAPDIDPEERLVGEWRQGAADSVRLIKSGPRFYKLKTRESLPVYHWPARLAAAGFVALFLSFALARFAPKLSQNITAGFDQVIVHPLITIVRYTSPDFKPADKAGEESPKNAITKNALAAYIIKNQARLKHEDISGTQTIIVEEEDLRGRVAGISEDFSSAIGSGRELSKDEPQKIGFFNFFSRRFWEIFK